MILGCVLTEPANLLCISKVPCYRYKWGSTVYLSKPLTRIRHDDLTLQPKRFLFSDVKYSRQTRIHKKTTGKTPRLQTEVIRYPIICYTMGWSRLIDRSPKHRFLWVLYRVILAEPRWSREWSDHREWPNELDLEIDTITVGEWRKESEPHPTWPDQKQSSPVWYRPTAVGKSQRIPESCSSTGFLMIAKM